MFWLRAWIAAAVVLAAGAARSAPLELYGRLPSIEAAAVSPDGSGLAMILTDGEQRRVVVQNLGDGTVVKLSAGSVKVRAITWAGPNHLIITASTAVVPGNIMGPRREWAEAFDLDIKGRRLRPLLKDVDQAMNAVFGRPAFRTIDGKPVLFLKGVSFRSGQSLLTVFRTDLEFGTSKLAETGTIYTDDYLLGAEGQAMAQALYEGKTGRWSLKIKDAAGWRDSMVMQAPNDHPQIVGFGRDGRSVLVEALEGDRTTYREISLTSGAIGEPLALPGIEGAIFDPADHNLIGYYDLIGDEPRYTFFDPGDQKVWAAVAGIYRGQLVHLISWSNDRSKLVVLVDSPTEGPAFALVDLGKHTATWLGGQYAALAPDDVSPVRALHFKAADGLDLTGYLTVPRGSAGKGLPLVVLPHGGPAVRDTPGFDWWPQALASRGYAVLQVNYRGSDGFGWLFLSAGFGQWGRKMQTDLSDGVRFLAKDGVIDPKRVCIVGGSYGGYAALAGAALEPGTYRCAASYAGLSDMRRMVAWSRNQNGATAQRYWLRFMGGASPDDAALAQISPALQADKVQIPVLLMHGRDDTVVPLEQSRIMADALKSAGKPVDFVILEGADHWLSRGDTRLAMLKATVAFLEKNNPPN